MASKLHLELALTPDGWRRDVVVRIDHGVILGLEEPGRSEAQRVSGVVLPGLPNLHSHAFQRAMAGLTERDRKSTRLNSSHTVSSYAVFCLKKKKFRFPLSPKVASDLMPVSWSLALKKKRPPPSMNQPVKARADSRTSFSV